MISPKSEQSFSDFVFHLFQFAAEQPVLHDVQAAPFLGFTLDEIEKISRLTLADTRRLSHLSKHFLASIQIDHDVFGRVLERLETTKQEEQLQDELIKLGAPFGMMAELFGMNGHEYAERRKSLGLTRVGRPPIPSESEQLRIYEIYKRYAGLEEPKKWVKMGHELGLNLTAVWPLVKTWGKIAGVIAGNSMRARASREVHEHRMCA